ncbi:MAG: large subunit ribosomal protein L24 [Candidatus Deianiraeaceae bacterium]|jgi:large subunit ribosomal protein L24
MLNKRISKKYKVGDKVILLVGGKDFKRKSYTIKSIKADKVILDGYKTMKRTQKITQENTENFKTVEIPVHISNIVGATEDSKPSRIAFKLDGENKIRVLKKTGEKI